MGKAAVITRAPNETQLQFQARLVKVTEEAKRDPVNQHARQHGNYVEKFVQHHESGTKTKVTINRGGTAIFRWMTAGKPFYEAECKAIGHCLNLWARAENRAVNDYTGIASTGIDGMSQQCALDELARYKERFPRAAWDTFEMVARFDEPAGFAGSGLANNKRSAVDAAKVATALVAGMIAIWNGY